MKVVFLGFLPLEKEWQKPFDDWGIELLETESALEAIRFLLRKEIEAIVVCEHFPYGQENFFGWWKDVGQTGFKPGLVFLEAIRQEFSNPPAVWFILASEDPLVQLRAMNYDFVVEIAFAPLDFSELTKSLREYFLEKRAQAEGLSLDNVPAGLA